MGRAAKLLPEVPSRFDDAIALSIRSSDHFDPQSSTGRPIIAIVLGKRNRRAAVTV